MAHYFVITLIILRGIVKTSHGATIALEMGNGSSDHRNGCASDSRGSELPRSVSVASPDVVGENVGIAIVAEASNRTVTENDPAMIRVAVTNQTEQSLTIYPGSMPVFGEPVSTVDDGNRVVLRQNSGGVDETDKVAADCWQWNHEHVSTGAAPYSSDVEPGGVVSEDFLVYEHPENDDPCLPFGEYRFVDSYRLETEDGREDSFEWGFSVAIVDGS